MVTVCTLASHDYLDFAKALACSVRVNWPFAKMVVALVNSTTEAKEEIERAHPGCQVFMQKCKKHKVRAECSNRKGDLLKQVRDEGSRDILMWVDADSLAIARCDRLEQMLSKDLHVRLKPNFVDMNGLKVQECYSGVFAFGPSAAATEMLNDYKKCCETNISFGTDQSNLALIYSKYLNKNVGHLDETLLDFEMKKESYIWTLKCEPKEINSRFMKQRSHYLELAKQP